MSQSDIFIDLIKLNTIAIWPMSKCFQDIQILLRFANFYCQFIEVFNKMALGLSNILKDSTKKKYKGIKFVLIGEPLEPFNNLKYFFAYTFMLIYYNLMCHIMLECNMSKFAILAILLQLIKKTGQ